MKFRRLPKWLVQARKDLDRHVLEEEMNRKKKPVQLENEAFVVYSDGTWEHKISFIDLCESKGKDYRYEFEFYHRSKLNAALGFPPNYR